VGFFDKLLKKNKEGLVVPQYFNKSADDFEVLEGSNGSLAVQLNSYAQEPFNSTTDTLKKFDREMNGFVISNDGDTSLYFVINGYTFEVKAGEVFEEMFAPFKEVLVLSKVPFRAYAKGKDAASFNSPNEYFIKQGAVRNVTGNPATHKGSEFISKKEVSLIKVRAHGTPLSWELWKTNGSGIVTGTSSIAKGTFTGANDFEGYKAAELSTPFLLVENQAYILMIDYGSSKDAKYVFSDASELWKLTDNEVLRVTGRSLAKNGTVVEGNVITGDYVYDLSIGVD
jgi:hypothetical protein